MNSHGFVRYRDLLWSGGLALMCLALAPWLVPAEGC
jgi:hypothetical protein